MLLAKLKVFLDTSVIFAAVLSPIGGGRRLFQLAEARVIQLILSPSVIHEADEVVRRKTPASLPDLAILLEAAQPKVGKPASPQNLKEAKRFLSYPPDAIVLAEALQARPDWFVTHDKEHFLDNAKLKAELPFHVGTPGDLIQQLQREALENL